MNNSNPDACGRTSFPFQSGSAVPLVHPEKCIRCRKMAFAIQLGATLSLMILKFAVGYVGNSKAMLAGALYTATNVVGSFATYGSAKFTDKPADPDHPYGYGKTEFILSAVVSGINLTGAFSLAVTAFEHIIHLHTMHHPEFYVAFAAVISVVANEALFKYLQCIGDTFNSAAITSNAWSIRTDGLTSVAVIASVIGVRIGFTHCDGTVALIMVLLVIWINGKSFISAFHGLMDRAVPEETLAKMETAAREVEGARIRDVRARFVGPRIWATVEVEMRQEMKMEEFDQIASRVRDNIHRSDRLIEKVSIKYQLCP